MTPADLARKNAIAFECKKDGLRQTQAGTWKVTFTVLDMDERLTRAFPGTRYQAVLVEIDENEMPVSKPPEKETNATPLAASSKPLPEAKRMDWRELQPAAQAGIRCADPVFWKFLSEEYRGAPSCAAEAADSVRNICSVKSRSELSSNHLARVLWHQLDEHFQAWKHVDA
jgi:hypothetical protein